jgi:hypothetical protein
LAICAAVAAERPVETRAGRIVRWVTPAIGFAVGAGLFALVAMPAQTPLGRFDPTLALRGWPQFAIDVDQLRARTGAAWVGTESYGVYSQLKNEGRIGAPLLAVIERDRYWLADPSRPDFGRPGLVVDLSRRMKRADVLRCFTSVAPAGELARAGGLGRNERYSAFLVSGPRRDVWITGCPSQISPGVWR